VLGAKACFGQAHLRRRVQVDFGRLPVGDERVAVEDLHGIVGVADNLERGVERDRAPQVDLRLAAEQARHQPGGVAAVAASSWPVEAARNVDRLGHAALRHAAFAGGTFWFRWNRLVGS